MVRQTPRSEAASKRTFDADADKAAADAASAAGNPVSPSGDGDDCINAEGHTPTRSRGRGQTRNTPAGRFGKSVGGVTADGGAGGGTGAPKVEASAWAVAMSEAVGGLVRPDADACAPKLGFQ